jgi:hypothetical protein
VTTSDGMPVQYRAGLLDGSGLAQQLRHEVPHRSHVKTGRRIGLKLSSLDLLLLPGRAIRPEHRLNVVRLKRPAWFEHSSRSERMWQAVLLQKQQFTPQL